MSLTIYMGASGPFWLWICGWAFRVWGNMCHSGRRETPLGSLSRKIERAYIKFMYAFSVVENYYMELDNCVYWWNMLVSLFPDI